MFCNTCAPRRPHATASRNPSLDCAAARRGNILFRGSLGASCLHSRRSRPYQTKGSFLTYRLLLTIEVPLPVKDPQTSQGSFTPHRPGLQSTDKPARRPAPPGQSVTSSSRFSNPRSQETFPVAFGGRFLVGWLNPQYTYPRNPPDMDAKGREHAESQDRKDALQHTRDEFVIPTKQEITSRTLAQQKPQGQKIVTPRP